MLAEMTPEQLCHWRVYLEGQGLGDDEQRSAIAIAAVVNELRELRTVLLTSAGVKRVKTESVKPDRYVRRWRRVSPQSGRRQSAQELMRALNGV